MKNFEISRLSLCAGAAAVALFVSGCGSGSDSDGQVRLINATNTHTGLDFYVSTTKTISDVVIGTASAYAGVTSGNPATSVDDAGGTTTLGSFSPTITKDQHSALLAYESSGKVYFAIFTEETTAPSTGSAQLTFRNFSYDAGSLDVYVVPHNAGGATAAISGQSATYTLAAPTAVGTAGVPQSGLFTPGTYDIVATAGSNQADIRLYMPSVVLADEAVDSVILTPTAGGILVDGALLVQQGAYTAVRNTLARVKLVNGVASNDVELTASTVSTPVKSLISPYTISPYASIAASSSLGVTVDSQSVQVSPATMTAGTDYTVLVGGGGTVPYTATLLTDDNHLPTTTGDAKIRLVNGFSSVGAMTLVVDSYEVGSGSQAFPTASAYTQILADASATFAVATQTAVTGLASGVTDPCLNKLYTTSNSTVKVNSGSVYSLYVLGDNSVSPATYNCVLRADR